MPLDVSGVAPIVTACIVVRVAWMFGWWWGLWRTMLFPTRCWRHFVGSRTGKKCSRSACGVYAADVPSTHHPCRCRRMSSLDSVTSLVRCSMIALSWLFLRALYWCACCVCGNKSACVWWWVCVCCSGLCSSVVSAFCCGFMVCWCAQFPAAELVVCFVVTGLTYPSLNCASLALSLSIVVRLHVSHWGKRSEQPRELEFYHQRKRTERKKWKERLSEQKQQKQEEK